MLRDLNGGGGGISLCSVKWNGCEEEFSYYKNQREREEKFKKNEKWIPQ